MIIKLKLQEMHHHRSYLIPFNQQVNKAVIFLYGSKLSIAHQEGVSSSGFPKEPD